MKYEDVEKAHSLKMAIDETKKEIDYFVSIKEDKTGAVRIHGGDIENPLGHMVITGNTKYVICDVIIRDLTNKLEKFKKELEEI